MPELTITQLTETTLEGNGVFDKLMGAVNEHIQAQYVKGSIRGPEFSTVYLGAIQAVMQYSIQFLLEKDKVLLLDQQIALAAKELELADKSLLKADKEIELLNKQIEVATASINKSLAEVTLLEQKLLTEKAQTLNNIAESNSVIGKQNALYSAQTEGYARDAEQKVAKLMADMLGLSITTTEGVSADQYNGFGDPNTIKVINKLLEGIAVTPNVPPPLTP